jgi:hypothetical protein
VGADSLPLLLLPKFRVATHYSDGMFFGREQSGDGNVSGVPVE